MSNTATPYELELYRLLVERDPVASSKLYTYIVNDSSILSSVKKKYYSVDEDDLYGELVESILKLVKSPEKFNPEKRSLVGYFRMSLEGDAINLLEKQKRAEKNFGKVVELHPKDGNSISEGSTPETDFIHQEAQERVDSALRQLFKDEVDYAVACLILSNEKATKSYAAILNIGHLSVDAQQIEVKRVKDRIKKVVERSGLKKLIESYQHG